MTTYYLSHRAYTYSTVPTWNVAQEGDGLAQSTATSATASILINSVAVATNTIVIMGVTLTAVASGAGVTQFNVGATTSIQADNIANAINLATGLVNSNVANTTHQLRNMVYARGPTLGAPANTVQIMTRVGAVSMNYATNPYVAITASGWSSVPTITNFAGGVSGCWGWLTNDATQGTIWPSSIAVMSYGVLLNAAGAGPLAGQYMTINDVCNVRSNNTVITYPGANTYLQVWTSGIFIVDDGTIWTGDTGYFKHQWTYSSAAYQSGILSNVGARIKFTSRNQSRFIIEMTAPCVQLIVLSGNASSSSNSSIHFDNVTITDYSAAGTIQFGSATMGYSAAEYFFTRINYTVTQNRYYSPIYGIGTSGYSVITQKYKDIVFNYPAFTGRPATIPVNLTLTNVPSTYQPVTTGMSLTISNIVGNTCTYSNWPTTVGLWPGLIITVASGTTNVAGSTITSVNQALGTCTLSCPGVPSGTCVGINTILPYLNYGTGSMTLTNIVSNGCRINSIPSSTIAGVYIGMRISVATGGTNIVGGIVSAINAGAFTIDITNCPGTPSGTITAIQIVTQFTPTVLTSENISVINGTPNDAILTGISSTSNMYVGQSISSCTGGSNMVGCRILSILSSSSIMVQPMLGGIPSGTITAMTVSPLSQYTGSVTVTFSNITNNYCQVNGLPTTLGMYPGMIVGQCATGTIPANSEIYGGIVTNIISSTSIGIATRNPMFGLIYSPNVLGNGPSTHKIFLQGITVNSLLPVSIITAVNVSNYTVYQGMPSSGNAMVIENCQGVVPYTIFGQGGVMGSSLVSMGPEDPVWMLQENVGIAGQFRLDACSSVLDWNPLNGYPTLDQVKEDGTPWSWCIQWAGAYHLAAIRDRGSDLLRLSITAVSSGSTTVTIEMLVDPIVAPLLTIQHLTMTATCVGTDNLLYSATTKTDWVTSTVIPTSTKSWTLNSYASYVPVKMTLTMPVTIKTNSEVDVRLVAFKQNPHPSGMTTSIFVNPFVYLS